MNAVEMGVVSILSESRRDPRKSVIIEAVLITADGEIRARVRDLSNVGAKVSSSRELTVGGDLIFKRNAIFAAARVVWSGERDSGLEFYRPLTLEVSSPNELSES